MYLQCENEEEKRKKERKKERKKIQKRRFCMHIFASLGG